MNYTEPLTVWHPSGALPTQRTAVVAPRMPSAATSNSDADLAPGAVAIAVALVPIGALRVLEVHTPPRAAHGLGAAAVDVAAPGVVRTSSAVDNRPGQAAWVTLGDGHTWEQGEQPAAQERRASELERLTPRDGASSKPPCRLVETIEDSLLVGARFLLAFFGWQRLLLTRLS